MKELKDYLEEQTNKHHVLDSTEVYRLAEEVGKSLQEQGIDELNTAIGVSIRYSFSSGYRQAILNVLNKLDNEFSDLTDRIPYEEYNRVLLENKKLKQRLKDLDEVKETL